MSDPDTKRKASRKRQRNFLAKVLLSDSRFKKKIHEDTKAKAKEKVWRLDDAEDETNDATD